MTQYVHLGCALDRGATLKLEAQRRTARAQGAFQEHRRRIYQNKDIPLPIRGTLFTAMVESTMFNLEIWGKPHGCAWDKLRAGHTKLLRRLVALDLPPDRVLSARLSDLVTATEHPPLEVVAIGKRLRYVLTLARGAPSALWALLHLEGHWQRTCRSDFEWFLRHDSGPWPAFDEANWAAWWQILRDNEGFFRRGVSRAMRTASAFFAIAGTVDRLNDSLVREAYRHYPMAFRFRGEEAWVCGPCRKVFKKKANLACHLFKVHNRQCEARFYLTGAICIGCGKDFVTEDRLQRHLAYSLQCWEVVKRGGTTTAVAGPGIGSGAWRRQKLDCPILHPPLPADIYVSGSSFPSSQGETPGDAYARQCTWALGEWLSCLPDELTLPDFVSELVRVLIRYPLYPAEMQRVLDTTCCDVDLCAEADLLEWSLQRLVQVKTWIRYCREAISGRWLCEWGGIPEECDAGPCKLLPDGAATVLQTRCGRLQPCSKFLGIGHLEPVVERTLGLKGICVSEAVTWDCLPDVAADLFSACAIACLVIPGEADAGGVMSTTALDNKANERRFSLSRLLLDLEPQLKELWRLFLRGAGVCLFICGLRDCEPLFRKLSFCAEFQWSLVHVHDRCACLLSDGRDLSSLRSPVSL